jgi:serine/threonine protein kinase
LDEECIWMLYAIHECFITVPDMLDDRDDPYLGQTLGHYEIIRPLGHGGMGNVYQASRSPTVARAFADRLVGSGRSLV